MAKVTADEFVEKYTRRMKGALEDIRRGVDRVTEAPTKKAAEKVDKMRERWLRALEEGKIQRGLERVSLDEWKAKMKDKGISRIPAGVDGAKDKMRDFADKLLKHIDAGLQEIKNMPDVTIEDSIARVEKWIRHMSKFKR